MNAETHYARAFGARERLRPGRLDGKIDHAEMEIRDSVIMLADSSPQMSFAAPRGDAAPVDIHLYVADADTTFGRAITAGVTAVRSVCTRFYGDRIGTVRDRFGHRWHVATHVEGVTTKEIDPRMKAMFSGGPAGA